LVKTCHFFLLTDKIASNQKNKLSINPNTSTSILGLSRPGITAGTTVEPKNRVPTLIKMSASLSSCASVRNGGLSSKIKNNLGIVKNHTTLFSNNSTSNFFPQLLNCLITNYSAPMARYLTPLQLLPAIRQLAEQARRIRGSHTKSATHI